MKKAELYVIDLDEYNRLTDQNSRLREALLKYPEWLPVAVMEEPRIEICLLCDGKKIEGVGDHKEDCLRKELRR